MQVGRVQKSKHLTRENFCQIYGQKQLFLTVFGNSLSSYREFVLCYFIKDQLEAKFQLTKEFLILTPTVSHSRKNN